MCDVSYCSILSFITLVSCSVHKSCIFISCSQISHKRLNLQKQQSEFLSDLFLSVCLLLCASLVCVIAVLLKGVCVVLLFCCLQKSCSGGLSHTEWFVV